MKNDQSATGTGSQAAGGRPALRTPEHPVRIVTAASLFDGHDASINIMGASCRARAPR